MLIVPPLSLIPGRDDRISTESTGFRRGPLGAAPPCAAVLGEAGREKSARPYGCSGPPRGLSLWGRRRWSVAPHRRDLETACLQRGSRRLAPPRGPRVFPAAPAPSSRRP